MNTVPNHSDMKTYIKTCRLQSSAQCTEADTGSAISGASAGKTPEGAFSGASGSRAERSRSVCALSSAASPLAGDAYTGFPVSPDGSRGSAPAGIPSRSKALRKAVSANYKFGFVEIGGRPRSASSGKLNVACQWV